MKKDRHFRVYANMRHEKGPETTYCHLLMKNKDCLSDEDIRESIRDNNEKYEEGKIIVITRVSEISKKDHDSLLKN